MTCKTYRSINWFIFGGASAEDETTWGADLPVFPLARLVRFTDNSKHEWNQPQLFKKGLKTLRKYKRGEMKAGGWADGQQCGAVRDRVHHLWASGSKPQAFNLTLFVLLLRGDRCLARSTPLALHHLWLCSPVVAWAIWARPQMELRGIEPSPLQQDGKKKKREWTSAAKAPVCGLWRFWASHEQQVIMG